MGNYFNHNGLRKMIAETEHLEPFNVIKNGDGYIAGGPAGDERMIMRVVLNSEAERRGARGLSPEEGIKLMFRFIQLPDIENAALSLQRENAILRNALQKILPDLQKKKLPPDRDVAKAVMALRSTD